MTLDSEKSLLSATLVPSFKCTLKPFSVTLFELTYKLTTLHRYASPALPLYVSHNLRIGKLFCFGAGKRAYPGRNPDTVIFHRVPSANWGGELAPWSCYQTFHPRRLWGTRVHTNSCVRCFHCPLWVHWSWVHWSLSLDTGDPSVGHFWLVWRRERVGYLPQQSATPAPQGVGASDDFFACYERCDGNSPCQSGFPATDVA